MNKMAGAITGDMCGSGLATAPWDALKAQGPSKGENGGAVSLTPTLLRGDPAAFTEGVAVANVPGWRSA